MNAQAQGFGEAEHVMTTSLTEVMSEKSERHERDYWPLCAVCGKVVESLAISPMPFDECMTRTYAVSCHGQTEISVVGIWAAFEIAQQHKRLPDAFKCNSPILET